LENVETKKEQLEDIETIAELIRLCDRFDVFEYEKVVTCEIVVQIIRIKPEKKCGFYLLGCGLGLSCM